VTALRGADVAALLDWKRQISAAYARVRAGEDTHASWRAWRAERDRLFGEHPQSPLPEGDRASFAGLATYDYDPSFRVLGAMRDAPGEHYEIPTSGTGSMSFTRFASVEFTLTDRVLSLQLYWLDGYGGGLFLPFRDSTSGTETYGAGRYMLDTVKGADLGVEGDRLVLDFNFAYNPSCAYDPRWVCPLAPPPNRLDIPITAGERL
jgi:uncharacterized protein